MTTEINKFNIEEPDETLSMNPKRFLLWLGIVSIVMMFAGWTSAYLVRRAEGNWHDFELPAILSYSTGVLLLSSIFMHWALISAKKDNFTTLKIAISITFVLGLAFLAMQYLGFADMVDQNLYLAGGDVASSFIYVFVFMHGLHIISGLVVLIFSLVSAFKMDIHAKNLTRIQNCVTYWHFLDVLWLYLFVFLMYNR
jgi:cytochrome c oxidase subunit III